MAKLTDCPACRCQLRVPDHMIERRVRCPTCDTVFWAVTDQPVIVYATAADSPVAARSEPPPVGRAVELSSVSEQPRKPRFRCPFCQSTKPPTVDSRMSQTGWLVLILSLFMCFPLFVLGFLFRENVHYCRDCGIKLG